MSVNDRVSDIGMSAALEIVSVSDRVSESETLVVPVLETVSVNDRVSDNRTSMVLEILSVNDRVSESGM